MTVRVMLVSPAMTVDLREARFGGPGPLDESGVRAAAAAVHDVPRADLVLRGSSVRCRETAEALGLRAEAVEALADLHVGDWAGRTLAEVGASEPEALALWLRDPAAAPHGGESLRQLSVRVGQWLESLPARRVLAVVEPAVVRAVTVVALGLAPETFWRLDVGPLTLTELSGRQGRWNLHCGRPLGGSGS
ncbi:histidine phosphatase family protein [Streptomyces sp. NPDC056500]|uniref:histidine phosphatase family protein n=1 Tax=Streptomyces sp. NPDC056500 TaxID=3345840 RepID=UPI00369C6FBE